MRNLSTLEQSLIIAALVDQPKRPGRFSLGWFQQQIDIGEYSDYEVKAAIDAMCRDKILYCDVNAYFMQRTQYLELRERFRWPLRRDSAVRKLCFLLGLPLEAFHHHDLGFGADCSNDCLGIKMAWDKMT